jgi:TolB protein
MNADGGEKRRLTRNGGRNVAPAWSPDGQRIAFERHVGRAKYGPCLDCGRASTFQVYVMNANGTQARKLAQDGAQPVWSPDGRKIAFTGLTQRYKALPPSETNVFVMNADGSAQRNLTRDAGVRDSQPVWSPAQK